MSTDLKNKNFNKKLLFITIILLFLTQIVFSTTIAAEENKQNSQGKENEEAVYIDAARLEYQNKKTILTGGIKVRKKDTVINALKGELIREEQKMILEEKINVEYPDGKVKSKLLTAFLKNEEYIFENKAVLNYTLSDGRKMILNSDYLKIFGEDNSFIAKKSVKINYDQQVFKGDKADYDGESEKMKLTGNVKIEEGNDWIRSESANFNLQEGKEGYTAEGNVEIKMILD